MMRGSAGHHTFLKVMIKMAWVKDKISHLSDIIVYSKSPGLQTCQKLRRWWSEQIRLMNLELPRISGGFGSLPNFSK